MEEKGMKQLTWNYLTDEEKEQARESYICFREQEEERERNDVTSNPDYGYVITGNGVENCRFERNKDGYIFVNI